jgi:hypothetical protein
MAADGGGGGSADGQNMKTLTATTAAAMMMMTIVRLSSTVLANRQKGQPGSSGIGLGSCRPTEVTLFPSAANSP